MDKPSSHVLVEPETRGDRAELVFELALSATNPPDLDLIKLLRGESIEPEWLAQRLVEDAI